MSDRLVGQSVPSVWHIRGTQIGTVVPPVEARCYSFEGVRFDQ